MILQEIRTIFHKKTSNGLNVTLFSLQIEFSFKKMGKYQSHYLMVIVLLRSPVKYQFLQKLDG